MQLKELAQHIGAELVGDGTIDVTSANTLEDAAPGQLSFLANPRYAAQLQSTRASAVIASPRVKAANLAMLKAKDPYYAFAQAVVLLHGHRRHPHAGVHPSAHVDPAATIGEGSIVYPGAYVGPRARVGRDCIIYSNAVVYDDCVLGDRVILHAGVAIGPDGYGFATHAGEHHKIPQVGNVVIEDDVEIGANTVIARAALGSTIIGKGSKIDALVMVAHNVHVGAHALLVGQCAIAGSATLGHHVTVAGQVGIAGHLKLGNQVTIGAQSGVMEDLADKSIVVGTPAMPMMHARRVYAAFRQLPDLLARLRRIERQLGVEPADEEDETDII